ncbi:MAG: hypothetical protein JST75_03860 [Bacteroidetes bacterium]|nr:hypothetical protein [Bacteroidota bacterium]
MKKVFSIAAIPAFGYAMADDWCNSISRVDNGNLCTVIKILEVAVLISILIFIGLIIFKSQILKGEKPD